MMPVAQRLQEPLSALQGEREGPAQREGEVGEGGHREIPHLSQALSAPRVGEGEARG
jgi:hypothetical protein